MHPSVTLEGQVVRKRINRRSKSDQHAVVLVAPDAELKLRRQGAAAFGDVALDALVGKQIRATGIVSAGQLIMSEYEVIDSADDG
jgi:hypothetical protein